MMRILASLLGRTAAPLPPTTDAPVPDEDGDDDDDGPSTAPLALPDLDVLRSMPPVAQYRTVHLGIDLTSRRVVVSDKVAKPGLRFPVPVGVDGVQLAEALPGLLPALQALADGVLVEDATGKCFLPDETLDDRKRVTRTLIDLQKASGRNPTRPEVPADVMRLVSTDAAVLSVPDAFAARLADLVVAIKGWRPEQGADGLWMLAFTLKHLDPTVDLDLLFSRASLPGYAPEVSVYAVDERGDRLVRRLDSKPFVMRAGEIPRATEAA